MDWSRVVLYKVNLIHKCVDRMVWIIVNEMMEISLRYINDHFVYCVDDRVYLGRDVNFLNELPFKSDQSR